MAFSFDYGAVTREVIEAGLDAATIEPTGRVVFATFDTNPAMFAGVVYREALFDEVADGPPSPGAPSLWRAAAERLRALRVPGRTPCVTVRLAASGAARVLARPHAWSLDGEALSAPFVPGPPYASGVDERGPLEAGGAPFVVALRPGAHRLEGTVRLFEPDTSPRDLPFAFELAVAPGDEVALELSRASDGASIDVRVL